MTGEPSIQQEDGLGSITTLTAANGTVAETHTYDSFGNGNTTNSTGSLTNYFRYTGREYDTESGLYFYRARYYDSSLGRFLSEDPVGFDEGTNSYRYVRNDPALLIDPSGLRIIYLPPDPRDNTIVCDGHGGLSVQIGNPGTLGGPQQQECLINCAKVHEQTHISDTLAENPKVCHGKAAGVRLGFDPKSKAASEVNASNAEIDCLWNEFHKDCPKCKQIILDRIGDVEAYRDNFKKKQ